MVLFASDAMRVSIQRKLYLNFLYAQSIKSGQEECLHLESTYVLGTKLGVFHQLSLWVFLSHFGHVKTEARGSSVARGHSGCKWQNWSLNPGSTGDRIPQYCTSHLDKFENGSKFTELFTAFSLGVILACLFGKNHIRIYIIRTCAFLGNKVWQSSYAVDDGKALVLIFRKTPGEMCL